MVNDKYLAYMDLNFWRNKKISELRGDIDDYR